MRFMVEDFKASPKREFQTSPKSGRIHQQKLALKNSLLEAISKGGLGTTVAHTAEDGTVRIKIVVKREDLKQVLHAMKTASSEPPSLTTLHAPKDPPQVSLEQRLCALKRRALGRRGGPAPAWRPRLQSIPEECC